MLSTLGRRDRARMSWRTEVVPWSVPWCARCFSKTTCVRWQGVLERAVEVLARRIVAADGPRITVARATAAARLFFNAAASQALLGPDVAAERAFEESTELSLAAC